jgi:PAS domain-containing protein
MQALCAWCGTELRPSAPSSEGNRAITHGICVACAEYFFKPRDHSLRGFLNTLKTPVAVVDDDMRMIEANDLALTALGKTRDAAVGMRSGDVIECANAKLPGGCGRQVHCAACTLRNSVRETFETGEGFTEVPAWLRQDPAADNETPGKLRVLITTEKIGNVVMLRFDDIKKLRTPPASARGAH